MKKKILILIIGGLLLTACGGNTKDITCKIGGKEAIFTLKDGIIFEYTFDGVKVKQSVVDEINGEYFTSAKDNEEGKEALDTYMQYVNGSCD